MTGSITTVRDPTRDTWARNPGIAAGPGPKKFPCTIITIEVKSIRRPKVYEVNLLVVPNQGLLSLNHKQGDALRPCEDVKTSSNALYDYRI